MKGWKVWESGRGGKGVDGVCELGEGEGERVRVRVGEKEREREREREKRTVGLRQKQIIVKCNCRLQTIHNKKIISFVQYVLHISNLNLFSQTS